MSALVGGAPGSGTDLRALTIVQVNEGHGYPEVKFLRAMGRAVGHLGVFNEQQAVCGGGREVGKLGNGR